MNVSTHIKITIINISTINTLTPMHVHIYNDTQTNANNNTIDICLCTSTTACINNLINTDSTAETKQLFIEFNDYLDTPGVLVDDYFEFKAWTESHVQNKPMLELFN